MIQVIYALGAFVLGVIILCIVLYIVRLAIEAAISSGITFLTPQIKNLVLAFVGLVGFIVLLILLWNLFGDALSATTPHGRF